MQTETDHSRRAEPFPTVEGSPKAQAFFTLGMRAVHRGDIEDAVALFREAVACSPGFVDAHYNLARAFKDLGELPAAAEAFRHVLELQPGDADAWYTLGNTYAAMDEPGKAEGCYRTALSLRPQEVRAYNNLAVTLQTLGRSDEAEAVASAGLAIDPGYADLHYNRALALLLDGVFTEGWKEFEWRFETADRANPLHQRDVPRWDGGACANRRLLLVAEQGFGDMIQFVRFAPLLKSRGARVILECPQELATLLGQAPGVDEITLRGSPSPMHDLWAPLLSLPFLLALDDERSLGQMVPYLTPDPVRVSQWRNRIHRREGDVAIGIVWSGNPHHKNDRHRSCPPELLAPLFSRRGVHWYRLDIGPEGDPARTGRHAMIDHTRHITDFADTAAFISQLDLVISVDTSVAHLAGALGKPVWVMLPFAPDWRWMHRRNDSPWYPGMRLFRQEKRGDWNGVIREVMESLDREFGGYAGLAARRSGPTRFSPSRQSIRPPASAVSGQGMVTPVTLEQADAFLRAGNLDQAIEAYEQLIRLHDGPVGAWNNLGIALQHSGRLKRAVAAFERAADLDPNSAAVLCNLGYALLEDGDTAQAESVLTQAVQFDGTVAEVHNNLGNVFLAQGRHGDAIGAYRTALACRTDYAEAHWNLAQVLLQTGDFANGWREYEWRWRRHDFTSPRRMFDQPLWSGEELRERTILLHAEQGFGDALQFVRYVPDVLARGGTVIVECQPAVLRLFQQSFDGVQIVPLGSELPPFDVHLPLMSLPRVLETTLETVPAAVPYLFADLDQSARWSRTFARSRDTLIVGIVWSGTRRLKALENRRCPLAALSPLLSTEGVTFFSLQTGEAAADLNTIDPAVRPADLARELNEFADTAAILDHLDLLITVDTAAAHLAGAMGKTVWVLLPERADWRWMLGRADSPWYPTMRLFRQQTAGDWDPVVTCVAGALRRLRENEAEDRQ